MKTNRKSAATKAPSESAAAVSGSSSLPPSLDALYHRPGFMLRRAHQISVSLFMQQPDATDITTTQYGVLVILRACEGLDQISLAKKVGLDRSTTGLVITKLETSGYVVRVTDPQDLRRKVIVLTAKGERKLESLKGVAARSQEMALSVFTPAEARQFVTLLSKFVAHFNETTRAPIVKDE
jgi:MarR family transcriptional regulator, lower aerobic nicotinate degradation pathway regulator